MTVFKTLLILTLFSIWAPYHASAQPGGPAKPVSVIVQTVTKTDFTDQIEALGTLKANENVDLASTVTELVTKIHFEDGQRVQEGDVLVEMDVTEEKAELAEEQSLLREATRQVNRLKPLAERGAASKSTLDEWRRQMESSRARIQAIQSRINLREIRAPFDGVVGQRNISVGALAQPGTMITTIDDDNVMKLDFSVPSVFLAHLSEGLKITAKTRAFPGKIFEGVIKSIDSRVDPVTRSVTVRAIIDNPEKKLKPGLLMQVNLQKNPRKALVIQEEALLSQGSENFVFRIIPTDEGKSVEQVKVEIGARRKGEIEILEGLSENDEIVIHGVQKVRPGAPVSASIIDPKQENAIEKELQKTLEEQGKRSE